MSTIPLDQPSQSKNRTSSQSLSSSNLLSTTPQSSNAKRLSVINLRKTSSTNLRKSQFRLACQQKSKNLQSLKNLILRLVKISVPTVIINSRTIQLSTSQFTPSQLLLASATVVQISFKASLCQPSQVARKLKKMFLICLHDEEITISRIL